MTIYMIKYNNIGDVVAINRDTGNIDSNGTISAVLMSVNNIINEYGTVIIKEGEYNPDSQVIFTKNIKIIADGNVIFNWNISGKDLFRFLGYYGNQPKTIADVPAHTNTIYVASIDLGGGMGDIMPGDLVILKDNIPWNPADFPSITKGELHEISFINGNTITIKDATILSYNIINSSYVVLLRPITVEINGITIIGGGEDLDYRGITLEVNKNSKIQNCKLYKNGFHEIVTLNSYNTIVENNIIGDNIYPGFGYGVGAGLSSAFTLITRNYFYNSRHCIAQGGGSGDAGGIPRDTGIIGNIIIDSTGTYSGCNCHKIDAHANVESCYIYNNIIYCPPDDYAIRSGARITMIVGNKIVGGNGIGTNGTTYPGYIFEVADNTLIDAKYLFDSVSNEGTDKVIIENNQIMGNICAIGKILNATSFIISGNEFDSDFSSGNEFGIHIVKSNNGIISNNFIHNSYYSGIKLDSSNDIIVSNNIIKNYNNSGVDSESGINIKNSYYNNITNNMLINPDVNTRGIIESGTSNYNKIFGNDLSQVGTIVANRLIKVGTNSTIWKNTGYLTENNILSTNFPINSTGIKTVIIPHGLAILPSVQDCCLTVVKNTNVTDWTYNLLIIDSVDITNVTAKINISKASTKSGATAKLVLRVG